MALFYNRCPENTIQKRVERQYLNCRREGPPEDVKTELHAKRDGYEEKEALIMKIETTTSTLEDGDVQANSHRAVRQRWFLGSIGFAGPTALSTRKLFARADNNLSTGNSSLLWLTPAVELLCVCTFTLALLAAPTLAATNFVQVNLIADVAGVATITDPNLVGTWGISESANSPFWVSNTAKGTSTLYSVTEGAPVVPVVVNLLAVVPPSAMNQGKAGLPTGQVNNGYGAGNFEVVPNQPASYMFATLDGTISGWYGGVANNTAIVAVDNSANGAVYTGLAIGVSSIGPTLYAANFSAGTIDTFDHTFKPVTLAGGFLDSDLPAFYFPSNIQRYGRKLYVTYNLSNGTGSFALGGPGTGLIDVFDLNGNLLQRLVPNNQHLNLPWGVAVTGANFGSFSYALIVGNFGDGTISAFDLDTGSYLGTMQDGNGNNISINGLWGLQWGNGGNGGDPGTLYFAAASSGGQHGLFGSLKPAADSTLQ